MYIVYEGIDFAGKSTIAKRHAQEVKARFVMEPFTESESGKALKAQLVSNTMTLDEEIQGYAISRLDAFKTVVHQYLKHGRIVISDRNFITSMVYQSDNNVTMENVLQVNRKLLETYGYNIFPDVVFFIDITHETFVERYNDAKANGREINNKDTMFLDKDVFEKYRAKYKEALGILERNHEVIVFILTPNTANVGNVMALQAEAVAKMEERDRKRNQSLHKAKMAKYFAE